MVEKSLSQFTLLAGSVRPMEASGLIVGYKTPGSSYFEDNSDGMASCVLFEKGST